MNTTGDDVVRRSPSFRFLPDDHYKKVRDLMREERFEFGDEIVREGDEADAYYVLTFGRVRVIKTRDNGEEVALATLRPGDEFGEAALLDGGPRRATVRCSTGAVVLRVNREEFLELLEEHPEMKHGLELTARLRALSNFLYQFSNFGRLPQRALHSLVEQLTPVEFGKGDVIVREGDPPGPMYVIERGRVRVHAHNNGSERDLAFYREGDYFGELSILNESPRAASVDAVSDVRLLALAPASVRNLKEEHPEFRRLLEERLAQYSVQTEARVPLDFASELLPAETQTHDKTDVDAHYEKDEDGAEDPFADERGFFKRRKGRIRKIPYVEQIDEMDCGAASLAMICRHYGRNVNLPRIRELCHTSRDGTSLKAICQAATELGLAARALKVSMRNLPLMPLPAIVHWEGNHWMVLYDVSETYVRVADPALGPRRIPRAEFESKWSGYAALFDYTSEFEKSPLATSPLKKLAPFLRGHRLVLLQVLFLSLIVTFLSLLFPVFTQMVVDKVIVENNVSLLVSILAAMAFAVVFVQAASLVEQYLLSFAAVRIDAAILDFLTRQLLSLPTTYFSSRRTGDIQRRLDGARQVRQFAVQFGIGGLLALVTLIGALILVAIYSPLLAGVFLLTTPLYAGLMVFSVKVLRPLLADIEESQGKYSSHQIDAIKGMEAVKAASAELTFRDAMLNEYLSVAKKIFRSNFIIMSYDSVLQTVGMISTILFLWVGAMQVIKGQISVGAFVAISSLTAMAYGAILRTLGIWDQMQLVVVLLHRLSDIFDPDPEQGRDRSRLAAVPTMEGHIELRDVGFRYGGPEAPDILKHLNIEFAPGRTVAIVGRSGSGKTTLIKLLAGLVEPTEGTILFDRVDLKTLNYRDVRRHIGIVLQENHLFNETITRNISFGDPEPDLNRVLWCAETANAHDFIMRLPLGYETKVGESGLGLSGGQKQRIAIARALYLNPPVLIFDEATSALDTESERAIQASLGRLMAGRTCIVIAHRLSTIRDAHNIVVMDKGEIVEKGTHDQLMAQRGLYFYLSSQQLGL